MHWYLMTFSYIIIFIKIVIYYSNLVVLIKGEYCLIRVLLLYMALSLIPRQIDNNCSSSHIKKMHASTAKRINQF